jgi:hypothetical protein
MELYCQFASVETEERNRIFLVESEFPCLHQIGFICIEQRANVLHSRLWTHHAVSVSYILMAISKRDVFLTHAEKVYGGESW